MIDDDTNSFLLLVSQVWVSSDIAATWTLVTAAAPYYKRDTGQLLSTSSGGLVFLLGDTPTGDVWASLNGGYKWGLCSPAGGWNYRWNGAATIDPNDFIVVAGGASQTGNGAGGYANDVFVSQFSFSVANIQTYCGIAAPYCGVGLRCWPGATTTVYANGSVSCGNCSLAVPAPSTAFTVNVGQFVSFESPALSAGGYAYANYITPSLAQSATQPAFFGATPWTTGIAYVGSPWDAPAGGVPDGNQYVYLQSTTGVAPSMVSLSVTGFNSSYSTYYVDFWWGLRANSNALGLNAFNLDLLVTVNGVVVLSLNITGQTEWKRELSAPFAAPSGIAVITFSNTESTVSDQAILLDSIGIMPGNPPALAINQLTSFEYPVLTTAYLYSFVTQATSPSIRNTAPTANNPFTFATQRSGLGVLNGNFDPTGHGVPDGNQYAFIQTSSLLYPTEINVLVNSVVVGTSYYVDFWHAIRNYGSLQPITFVVTADNVVIFSYLYTSFIPWRHVQSSSFIASSTTTRLVFTAIDATSTDLTATLDAVTVIPTNQLVPATPQYSSLPSVVNSFESPVLSSPFYFYGSTPQIYNLPNASNPFTIKNPTWLLGGGLAQTCTPSPCTTANPWDPPGGAGAAPNGIQYAFIQTFGAANVGQISANFSSLTPGNSYIVSFFYGVRNQAFASTDTISLTVTVNNISVWYFLANVTNSPSGCAWTSANSSSFMAPSTGAVTVAFVVADQTTSDHAYTIDAVSVISVPIVPVSSTSSTSTVVPPLSISSSLSSSVHSSSVVATSALTPTSTSNAMSSSNAVSAATHSATSPNTIQTVSSSSSSVATYLTSTSSSTNVITMSSAAMIYLTGCNAVQAPSNAAVVSFEIASSLAALSTVVTPGTLIPIIINAFAGLLNVPSSTLLCGGVSDSDGALGSRDADNGVTTVKLYVEPANDLSANTLAANLVNFINNGSASTTLPSTVPIVDSSGSVVFPAPNNDNGGSSGLSNGAIAGIVVGSVIGVCCIVLIIAVLLCGVGIRSKSKDRAPTTREERYVENHDQDVAHDDVEMTEKQTI
jgi:hypothetical protein